MRIFSTSLIVVACFAACAAHATDATISALPEILTNCTVKGVEGRWDWFHADSPEQLQWYYMNGRLDTGCQLEGELTSQCYCNFGAPEKFVGEDWTDGNWNRWESGYMVPEPTPPIAGATWVRVFDTNGAPQGIPCNDPDVHCYYVALACENDVRPIGGKCPTSTTEQGPTAEQGPTTEQGPTAEQGPTTEPSNGATTSEQEHAGSPGCPKYTYRVENNECLPIGGYMDAHIPGNIRYAARKCTGDILRNYDPNATAGYWTQSIYGHHACPELGADDISGPYVRCACGSSQCKPRYTAVSGLCHLDASEGVTSDASDSRGDDNSTVVAAPSAGEQVGNDEGPCAEGEVRFSGIVRDGLSVEIIGVELYKNSEVIGQTDDNGEFTVCVPQNTEVQFVYRGYSTATELVGTEDRLNQTIIMTPNEDTQSSTRSGADTETISELAKTLDAIENAYGLSKWRTVDGKFNYARLASDATAAVVLGTTGALVTSSVVKKQQVEAGFESLECTVGGQHVGYWGDVFRIDGK